MNILKEYISNRIGSVNIRVRIIQEIINSIKAKTYLEIGVQNGSTFLRIRAPKKIAIDPSIKISMKAKSFFLIYNPKNLFNHYFEITSDDFFLNYKEVLSENKIDVAFIDGLHTFEQSLKDILNCLEYLNEKGIIVMHDCSPRSETIGSAVMSREEAFNPDWSGDVWKTIAYLRNNRNDLNVFVLNCDYGLGIITRGKPEYLLDYSPEELKNLNYEDFQKDRVKILNLKKPSYFLEFIKTL